MTPARERTLLQAAVALVCIVPFGASLTGILLGAAWLQPAPATDLDSHFRYLSGLFLGMGIAFASCVPGIERKTARFRLLGMMVVLGGLARLWSLVILGPPSTGHAVGLCIELIVVPLLLAWQARVARRLRLPG
ncbi:MULTISPECIES: DUF4345 domain-containing protein [Sphingomonas]|uniref:DUF4345 domain-containing protein n=1 Tax=Sphingomonas hankookensis TaxID=563996 RepID=A0ABR5YDY9_9SPHN|nr:MULTISPECIES: DUF4345 domain-containing protein [Sphingomonas]KZE16312.1 hypothetical protein AVT10_12510 [Sphingomonas hankookensis]PZT92826.1 MAG: DUF4345 domain-containing protein [Sphingomonas sp.]RSV31818.1 DUF4345 domain-containing protein [Sphingomonas sp. ABOLH]WCP71444.1 DUF4345 domain-containing protein [Sphingomonas hankookensis]